MDDLTVFFAILSIISAISGIVLFIIVARTLWNTAGRNVMWMALSDVGYASTCAMAYFRDIQSDAEETTNSPYCRTFGILITFSCTATILWYVMIAVNLILVLRGKDIKWIIRQGWWQHLIVWGYSLFMTILATALDDYAPLDKHDCWFQGARDPFRFLTIYGPVGLSLCVSFTLFIYVTHTWARQLCLNPAATPLSSSTSFHTRRLLETSGPYGPIHSEATSVASTTILIRIYSFLTLSAFTWILPFISRITDAVDNSNSSVFDVLLPGVFAFSGLGNLIVWGLGSPRLWGKCFQACPKFWTLYCCCYCNKAANPEAFTTTTHVAPTINELEDEYEAD